MKRQQARNPVQLSLPGLGHKARPAIEPHHEHHQELILVLAQLLRQAALASVRHGGDGDEPEDHA